MKNQLLASYKGSCTPRSRGWAGMGATGHSGRLDKEGGSSAAGAVGRTGAARPWCRGQGIGWCILWDLLSKQWQIQNWLGHMHAALGSSTPE